MTAALLVSCSKSGGPEYLPFQSEKDGKWGMIGTNGEVLFADEFQREPTLAYNGRFMVKNADDQWEIYTAEKKPVQVGKKYKYACVFVEDVAPVVEPGKCIELIDRDGNVVKKLDKLDGKTVVRASNFTNGLAVFVTDDNKVGVIDTRGNVVVKSEYYALQISDDAIVAIEEKYRKAAEDGDEEKLEVCLLNMSGKEMSRLKMSKFSEITGTVSNGYMGAAMGKGDEQKWGIIDTKGEWKVRPTSNIKRVHAISGDNFIFYDGEKYGLMNMSGEIVIRAKYDNLEFVNAECLAAGDRKDGSMEYVIIDFNDEKKGTDTYKTVYGFFDETGYFITKMDSHVYVFVDSEGKEVKGMKTNLYDIGLGVGDYYVESDFVDIPLIVAKLNIKKDGMDGMSFSNKVADVAKHVADVTGKKVEPEAYNYKSAFVYDKQLTNVESSMEIDFNETIASPIKKIETENYFGYTYSYEKTVGYKFADATPAGFIATFNNTGKMEGKLKAVFAELTSQIKKFGTLKKENKNASLVDIGNGVFALTVYSKDAAQLFIVKGDVSAIDISVYEESEDSDEAV